jgi:hypothetical protein
VTDLTPTAPPLAKLPSTQISSVAGLLRSNRGDAPRSPRSGVLTPPDPPKGLICKPVEPVASTAPELDSYAILLATVTTPLTRLSHSTFWRGSGGRNRPPGQGVWGTVPQAPNANAGATVSET